MVEMWMVWVIGLCALAAGSGGFFLLGFVKGQGQAKAWLDYTLACQANENVAAGHANVAQKLKDERTAAYFASKRGGGRQNRRDELSQAVNGHDEH